MLDWLLQLRAFVGDGIAQWRNLRVDGLQYPHRLETRLMVIGLVGVMLILVIGRLAMKRRAGRDQIVLPGLPASIRASRGSSMAHLPLVLFLIGLGFFAVALGDPHTPFFTSDVSFPGRRIAIVVDASSSMRRGFIASNLNLIRETESTFQTTMAAAKRFVEMRMAGKYRDLMALVEFGNEAYVITPFTNDYDNIMLSIALIGDPVEFTLFPDNNNTVIGLAVQQSVELFKAFKFLDASGNLLVLFSDGEDSHAIFNGVTLDEIMQAATEARIPVYFIRANWGLQAGKAIGDITWSEAVAKTGGKFYAASDEASLLAAISEIDKQGTGSISIRQYANQQPRFAMFAGAALLCWIVAAALKLSVVYFQKLP